MAGRGLRASADRLAANHARLYYAIEDNEAETVLCLLEAGMDPNTMYTGKDPMGRPLVWSPLHFCSEKGRYDCAELLLKFGADVDDTDKWQQTPLMYAVQTEWCNIVELLLQQGACVNNTDGNGQTALHHALNCSDSTCLRLLLDRGCDVDIGDTYARTPLWLAATEDGRIEFARHLITHGADTNNIDVSQNRNVLQAALVHSTRDRPEYVRMLLDAGASVNSRDKANHNSVLNIIRRSSRERRPLDEQELIMCELILLAGYDVNNVPIRANWYTYGGTALQFAVEHGATQVVDMLLQAGADPDLTDDKNVGPLLAACLTGEIHLVKVLIRYNCSLDIQGEVKINREPFVYTPLQCTINLGHLDIARLLVEVGAPIHYIAHPYVWTYNNIPELSNHDGEFRSWFMEQAVNVPPLMMLCQRSIRRMLKDNFRNRVKDLPLPRTLQSFLLLEHLLW